MEVVRQYSAIMDAHVIAVTWGNKKLQHTARDSWVRKTINPSMTMFLAYYHAYPELEDQLWAIAEELRRIKHD